MDMQVYPAAIARECWGTHWYVRLMEALLSPPPTPLPLTLTLSQRERGQETYPESAALPVEREEQDTLFLAPHSDTIGLSWVERTLSTAALPTRRQDDGVGMDQHSR